MVKLAITGGIACGKSAVGLLLARRGVAICEADMLAHAAMQPGHCVYDNVVAAFGRGILDPEGQIDRTVLGQQVFADPDLLARLNALVHPFTQQEWRRWLKEKEQAAEIAAVIVPLLFEIGDVELWDSIVCVTCSGETQLRRLLDRGLTEAEAMRRIGAQLCVAEKEEHSDFVVINNGTTDLLEEQLSIILDCIPER